MQQSSLLYRMHIFSPFPIGPILTVCLKISQCAEDETIESMISGG